MHLDETASAPRRLVSSTTIDADATLITLINVYDVPADKQLQLVHSLENATIEIMQKLPGFVSANIHRSIDGSHVANYAQWRSEDDFKAMLRHPEVMAHMCRIGEIAKAAPALYRVTSVYR